MTPKAAETKKRRSSDQIVADLEAQIAAVKQRAATREATKEVKGTADGIVFLASVKAVDKAIRVATERKNDAMLRALEAGRAPLAQHLVEMGVRLPDRKARKQRKAKAGAA